MIADTDRDPLTCVAVALDTADWGEFETWCRWFGPRVGLLKVGLEAFVRWGPRAVDQARTHARGVFLDLKLHDIPSTVAGAVASARALGADYVTVHAAGGPAMLSAATAAAGPGLGILAVTVLTHLDAPGLEALDLPGGSAERVARWAELARGAGCAGAICSPQELARLRGRHDRPFLLVTPGIRPAVWVGDDQRRTATARAARQAGADLLVVGRPLTRAGDPEAALAALVAELAAPDGPQK